MRKVYLGDGAYVELAPDGIWIQTENGAEVTNRVFLDEHAISGLLMYLESLGYLRLTEPKP